MVRLRFAIPTVLVAASLLIWAGCNAKQESAEPAATDAAVTADTSAEPDVEGELSKLSEEDRKLAMAQKVCPVSGEPLGSMGVPIKITVGGKSLFVCCEGCEQDAKTNFDEYFAKIHGQSAETKDKE
jgi:hypothetical protein